MTELRAAKSMNVGDDAVGGEHDRNRRAILAWTAG